MKNINLFILFSTLFCSITWVNPNEIPTKLFLSTGVRHYTQSKHKIYSNNLLLDNTQTNGSVRAQYIRTDISLSAKVVYKDFLFFLDVDYYHGESQEFNSNILITSDTVYYNDISIIPEVHFKFFLF